jgi:hypothetical protein
LDVRDLFEILEELGEGDLLQFAVLLAAFPFVSLVAKVTTGFDVTGRVAEKGDGEAFAHRFVVNPHRGRIEDFDRVRGILRVENGDRQIVAIDDLDRADHERILRGKELMTALVSRGDFVEHAMAHEASKDLAQGRYRSQRLGSVPTRIDDLQALAAGPLGEVVVRRLGGREALYVKDEEPFALAG